MRTSKKRMHEMEEALRYCYPHDLLYARYERDASGKAYILHNDEYTAYNTNTEAYFAALKLVDEVL